MSQRTTRQRLGLRRCSAVFGERVDLESTVHGESPDDVFIVHRDPEPWLKLEYERIVL